MPGTDNIVFEGVGEKLEVPAGLLSNLGRAGAGNVSIRTLDRGRDQLYELNREDMEVSVLVIWGGVPNSNVTSV